MARNCVSVSVGVRVLLAVAAWGAALGLAQATLGGDLARAVHELEQRIELRVRGIAAPAEPQPERSHEDESLEPWELVSV
jgi:hypothetical protein